MIETFSEKPDTIIKSFGPGTVYTTINYDAKENPDGTWSAISVTIETSGSVTKDDILNALIVDIDSQTDKKILSGFTWRGKSVWLSAENQRNFSEGQRAAMITNGNSLPITFKIGEDEHKLPIYHEFTTVEELTEFYLQGVGFINQTLNEGWRNKDAATEWVDSLEL